MSTEKQHLFTLDFLRGVAALLVVLFHFSSTGLSKLIVEPIRQSFSWGYLGVEIFFVISGFIIPFVLEKSRYKPSDFGNFIGKRFVRICPPSYIILLLTIIQFFTIDYLKISQNKWFENLTLEQIIHNFSYTIPFTNYTWINGVFWTLAVEFQFYLFIGLAFPIMFKNLKFFIIFSILLAGIFYSPLSRVILYLNYSTLFTIGGVTYLYFDKKITSLSFGLLLGFFSLICWYQLGILAALFGLGTSLAISFIHIKNKIGGFLGKISYSLYLTHILFGSSLETILIKLVPPANPAVKMSLMIVILLLAIAGAYLFYRIIEVYFINLSNTLFARKKTAQKILS